MTFDLVVSIEKLKTLTYKNWIAFLEGNNSSFAKDVYAEVAQVVNYELEALEAYTGKKLTLKDTELDGGEGPAEDFFDEDYWMYGEEDNDWEYAFREVSPKIVIATIEGNVTEADVSGYESDKHVIEDIDFPQQAASAKNGLNPELPSAQGYYVSYTKNSPKGWVDVFQVTAELTADQQRMKFVWPTRYEWLSDDASFTRYDDNEHLAKIGVDIGDIDHIGSPWMFPPNAKEIILTAKSHFGSHGNFLAEVDEETHPLEYVELDVTTSWYASGDNFRNLETIVIHGDYRDHRAKSGRKNIAHIFLWDKATTAQEDLPIVYTDNPKTNVNGKGSLGNPAHYQSYEETYTLYDCEWRPLSAAPIR